MDIQGKTIVVVGGARSGIAAAILLHSHGAQVFVSDAGAIAGHQQEALRRAGIAFEQGGHSGRAHKADMVVVSPGVPGEAPLIRHFAARNIPVYSEIEAASWFNRSRTLGITGSNGKTTVTNWLGHLWKTAGQPALVGGNIGTAASSLMEETSAETDLILEISSFQLDHIATFRPDIGVLLNITPDHLNRYKNSFDLYVAAKMKLAMNQTPDDVLVYNYDDPVVRTQIRLLQQHPGPIPRMLPYSLQENLEEGAFVQDDVLTLRLDGRSEALLGRHELALQGRHNCGNALAVALCGRTAGVSNPAIIESLRSFPGVEHRLEQVRVLGGVRYINDSKATNINAVWFALQSLKTPVVLILGGRDKGNDYRELSDQIKNKVQTLIAIGEAKEAIRTQIGRDALYYFEADTLEEAVRLSQKHARKGETVLLSPACASFDMFDSYEHRGRVFKQAVQQLED
ncbi:MAG: UDP-N-acetylmuramoyl-L-alanine--D-glutamate ligase [Cyclonatronaceae bacterium]